MERSTRLDLPLLLPDVADQQDRCIHRLVRLLERRDGIFRVHVVRSGEEAPETLEPAAPRPAGDEAMATEPQLCLHYDPDRITLGQLEELARLAGTGISARFAHAVIAFRAVGSEDDGRRLEAELRAIPGITAASVNFAGQVVRVEFDRRRVDQQAIEQALHDLGAPPEAGRPRWSLPRGAEHGAATPEPAPASPVGARVERAKAPHRPSPREAAAVDGQAHAEPRAGAGWYARNRELAWSLAAGTLLGTGWVLSRSGAPAGVSIACYAAAYGFGAWDNVGHFVRDLRRGHVHFNIDLLMVVAAIGAAVLGEWLEGALLLFLFSLGHALEHYALGRARHAISALAELAPQVARVIRASGVEAQVPIGEVRAGDQVVVLPAERIPVDGTVAEGRSGVNQAPITGESMPVSKAPGDPVFAGSVNGEGALVVTVTAAVGDRTLDRVIRLVAEAETQKAPTQQFTDRFERIFVPAVLIADLVLIMVPPLLGFWDWSVSFYRGMAVLVAASPCALALGTPAAVLAGIAQAARGGVLIKGGAHLEMLGGIRVLALDKTGTITTGEPAVTDVVPTPGTSEESLLLTAAAVEQRSQHPLARAVVTAATNRGLTLPAAGELESVTGRGVRSVVDGTPVEVGRLLMFAEGGASVPEHVATTVERLEAAGRSTMVVRRAPGGASGADGRGGWLGVIGVADQPRPNVRETLTALRVAGIARIVMLTGDNAGVGNAVGRGVGVDEVRAGLLPEGKVDAVRELALAGKVAMVGDGVNDAPALAHATVGIAMGGAGTAAALETADVALMGDDLGRLPFAIGLSRAARGIIRQNLYLSLGVIVLLVAATVSGIVRIGPAVIVHEGSTLVVIANALRLLGYGRDAA